MNPQRLILLVIDDAPGASFLFHRAMQLMRQESFRRPVPTSVQQVLPDAERASLGLHEITSMEDFLAEHSREVAICLIDCNLGNQGQSHGLELAAAAIDGQPPFEKEFRAVPTAMITAGIDRNHLGQRAPCPVLPKLSGNDLSRELLNWLRLRLRAVD